LASEFIDLYIAREEIINEEHQRMIDIACYPHLNLEGKKIINDRYTRNIYLAPEHTKEELKAKNEIVLKRFSQRTKKVGQKWPKGT